MRQMETTGWQVNEVNIVVECSNRFLIPKLNDLNFRDRNSVRAFHNKVFLVYLPVCSLRLPLSHTGGFVLPTAND